MRDLLLIIILFGATSLRAEDWTPPKNPDLQAILQEARADTRAKRYETALAKHVWFHENAVKIDPAYYGVRLSFALAYWLELSEQYPEALTKLIELRDAACRDVIAGNNARESFHDMTSINNYLTETSATKEVFETLDKKDPKTAKEVFDLARPALIKGKSYALIAKYISPKDDFAKISERFKEDKKLADDPRFGARHMEYANKSFAYESTTLVAILTVNDRKKEAKEIAASARADWDDETFRAALEKALKGIVPDPWP